MQEALLSGQTALSTILLVAAGLLFTTWSNLRQVDPGFDPEALVAVKLPIRPPTYDTSERLDQFAQGVIEGMRTSGGIDFVAGASSLLFERGLGVAGTDPETLGVTAAGILAVAIVACWIPAREAAEVDPVTALAS